MPVLQVDAHFTVVEAALKGYMKWRSAHGSKPQQDVQRLRWLFLKCKANSIQEQERTNMENNLEAWCERLLEMNFEVGFNAVEWNPCWRQPQDPIIRKRILQLAVAFSTTALDKKVGFMLKVLEHILMSRPVEQPQCNAYNDAVKELQTDGMYELQRLASKMPDQLLVTCPIK